MRRKLGTMLLAVAVVCSLLPVTPAGAAGDFIINDGVLSGCFADEGTVVIPEGVTAIRSASGAFNSGVEHIILPSTLEEIGSYAFNHCGITEIDIPDSVTVIGDRAFEGCENLERAVLPDGITELYGTFKDCTSLREVRFPADLRVLGAETFARCKALKSITLPDSLEEIGTWPYANQDAFMPTISGAFTYSGLETLTIPEGVTTISSGAFWSNKSLKSVRFPSSLVEIGESAFGDCEALAEISLPEGVQKIGSTAFQGVACTTVSLPGSLTEVGASVLGHCPNLTTIHFQKDTPAFAEMLEPAFAGLFFGSPNIREMDNIPCPAYAELLAVNQEAMSRWVNPGAHLAAQSQQVVDLSREIVGDETDPLQKAMLLGKWVSNNIQYDNAYYTGASNTVVTDVEGVLNTKRTICDGYARLTAALFQAQGIPALYVAGPAYGVSGWENHAWNEAYINGAWHLFDTTFASTGWNTDELDANFYYFSGSHNMKDRPYADDDDTPSSWARNELSEAIGLGLVPGSLQAGYRQGITREEFCRLMVALVERTTGKAIGQVLSQKGLTAANPFTDTNSESVAAAYALGIVTGSSATTFNPAGAITRQEAAAMLARTAALLGLNAVKAESFTDAGQFASWAVDGIALVSSLTDPATGGKVMGGTGNGVFSPAASYSREQAVLTALRLYHCAA